MDAAPVGPVRHEITARGAKRWTARLGDTKLAGAGRRAPRNRQDAAVRILMAYHAASGSPRTQGSESSMQGDDP